MGIYTEAFLKKLGELREILAKPMPVFNTDPQGAAAYIKQQQETDYLLKELRLQLSSVFVLLSEEGQKRIHQACTRGAKEPLDFEPFMNALRNKDSVALLEGPSNGLGLKGALEALEAEMPLSNMKPAELTQRLENLYPPTDRRSPKSRRLRGPGRPDLQNLMAMENSIQEGDPQKAEKYATLDQARAILTHPTADYLDYLNHGFSGFQVREKNLDLEEQIDDLTAMDVRNYVEKLDNGRFQNKLGRQHRMRLGYAYDGFAINPKKTPLSSQDKQDMCRAVPNPVPKKLKEKVLGIFRTMEAIGEQNYKSRDTYKAVSGTQEHPRYPMFVSEQSKKMYGFTPLVLACSQVQAALEAKDFAALKAACGEYQRIKGHTDQIMQAVQGGWGPVCPCNVNSTRPLINNEATYIPPEYLEDYVGHSRLNGMQLLYGLTKNAGISIEQLLDDPANVARREGEKHVQKMGLNGSDFSLGAKLFRALSSDSAIDFFRIWDYKASPLTRSFLAVSSLADTREETAAMETAALLGCTVGSYAVIEDKQLWEKLTDVDEDRREALYRCVALLPEDMDFRRLAKTVTGPNYRALTDTQQLAASLRAQGPLDLAALAQRSDAILQQAKAEGAFTGAWDYSKFKAEDYLKSACQCYRYLLQTATPQEKEGAGYPALTQKLRELEEQRAKLLLQDSKATPAKAVKLIQDDLARLKEEKRGGLFASKTNSPEHQKMTRALNRLCYKLKAIRGQSLEPLSQEDQTRVRGLDLNQEFRKARDATYAYYRLRSKEGTKEDFSDPVGKNRCEAAKRLLNNLDALAKKMDLERPAQLLLDANQRKLLVNRENEDWMEAHGEATLATLLYAQGVGFKNYSPEEEARRLSDHSVQQGVAAIQNDPAFRRMVDSEGLDTLVLKTIQGDGKLTDAYVKASNALKPAGERIRNLTPETRAEMWKNNAIGR